MSFPLALQHANCPHRPTAVAQLLGEECQDIPAHKRVHAQLKFDHVDIDTSQ